MLKIIENGKSIHPFIYLFDLFRLKLYLFLLFSLLEFHKVDLADDESEDSSNQEPAAKRTKRNRRTAADQSTKSIDTSIDLDATAARTRQAKNKQNAQQLLAEQQRVEQRVQQEQLKLKQQELLQQQQHKKQEEKRQQQLRASNEDISNLRTNPNISMRELFPGEEDLGLHVNLPFVSANDSNLFNLNDFNG